MWWIISFLYIPKINYLSHLLQTRDNKQWRENNKTHLLKKHVTLFHKIYGISKDFHLLDYKDYFTINGEYCDIEDEFFLEIEKELKKKNVIYKPKIYFKGTNLKNIEQKKLWKKVHYKEMKNKICTFIFSNMKVGNIEIELKNYKNTPDELLNVQSFILVWKYEIKKYKKTPIESVKNSETLINKISNELIYPWENISLLEKLLNNQWKDLLESNILENWKIVQWIWWGSCLASTIIYRTLLDAGVDIISQKTHNIYYKNIYGIGEIGLDSTIYKDDTYKIDLLFQNNYSSPIIFVPKFWEENIVLKMYAKKKQFITQLDIINIDDKDNVQWKYSVKDETGDILSTKIISSKYDTIDNY